MNNPSIHLVGMPKQAKPRGFNPRPYGEAKPSSATAAQKKMIADANKPPPGGTVGPRPGPGSAKSYRAAEKKLFPAGHIGMRAPAGTGSSVADKPAKRRDRAFAVEKAGASALPQEVLLGTPRDATAYIYQIRAMRKASSSTAKALDDTFSKQAYSWDEFKEGLQSASPLSYGLGGAGVGGLIAALREEGKRKRHRNYGNVLLGALAGGGIGAGGAAIAGQLPSLTTSDGGGAGQNPVGTDGTRNSEPGWLAAVGQRINEVFGGGDSGGDGGGDGGGEGSPISDTVAKGLQYGTWPGNALTQSYIGEDGVVVPALNRALDMIPGIPEDFNIPGVSDEWIRDHPGSSGLLASMGLISTRRAAEYASFRGDPGRATRDLGKNVQLEVNRNLGSTVQDAAESIQGFGTNSANRVGLAPDDIKAALRGATAKELNKLVNGGSITIAGKKYKYSDLVDDLGGHRLTPLAGDDFTGLHGTIEDLVEHKLWGTPRKVSPGVAGHTRGRIDADPRLIARHHKGWLGRFAKSAPVRWGARLPGILGPAAAFAEMWRDKAKSIPKPWEQQ